MVDATLLTLQQLSQDEKNVLKTFEKRINSIYPLKKTVAELVQLLDACKRDEKNRPAVNELLAIIRNGVSEVFANLDFTSATAEKASLDKFAREKRHLYEDLFRDQAAGGIEAERAGQKIAQILHDKEEELKAIGKAQTALEHFREGIILFQGMIKHEKELSSRLSTLIDETEKFTTPADIDHIMLEWRDTSLDIEKAVLQEKTAVFDRLQPLLEEKTWAEKLVEKYEKPRTKWFFFTEKITRKDIEKDISTIADPVEFQHYQSLLLKHVDILSKDALAFLQGEGIQQAKKQKLAFAKTTHLATHDEKTGLLRPHTFETVGDEMIELDMRDKRPLCFIFMDIDNFGIFNKRYGEEMGDKVLAKVAEIIRKHVRKSDVMGRWGGEELCVIAPDTPLTGGADLAEKLRESIAAESTGAAPEPVTVSVGVSILYQDGNTFAELMNKADERMRYSKAHGKNRVTVSSEASVITVQ